MEIKNVTVAGGGVLGSQIAFQAAYTGFPVKVWLRSEGSIDRARPKFEHLAEQYQDMIKEMSENPALAYCRGLSNTRDLDSYQIKEHVIRRCRSGCRFDHRGHFRNAAG